MDIEVEVNWEGGGVGLSDLASLEYEKLDWECVMPEIAPLESAFYLLPQNPKNSHLSFPALHFTILPCNLQLTEESAVYPTQHLCCSQRRKKPHIGIFGSRNFQWV